MQLFGCSAFERQQREWISIWTCHKIAVSISGKASSKLQSLADAAADATLMDFFQTVVNKLPIYLSL